KGALAEFKQLISSSDKAKVKKIREEKYDDPVKIGFEINERFKANNHRSVETTLKKMNRDLRDTHKDVYQTEKENRYIKQSNSWKYTTPLRKVGDFVKKLKGSKTECILTKNDRSEGHIDGALLSSLAVQRDGGRRQRL